MEKCKENVMHGFHLYSCSRKPWKDGFCKQHHPETVKARDEERTRKYNEKQACSPWRLLEKANARIVELEAELQELRGK